MLNAQPQQQSLLTRSMDIPSLPVGISSIVSIATSESATADDVAHAIMLDPALATKVLRMANSAFYGRLTKAETVTQAVVTLGFSAVKTVALAASVVDHVLPDKSIPGLDWKAFWLHCVATGAAAELIAKKTSGSRRGGESAFVAGLLHDVGKLIIARNVPSEYTQAVQNALLNSGDMKSAEQEVFCTDHSTVGHLLAQEWRLPESLASPIGQHHDEEITDDSGHLVHCVRAANMLAKKHYGSYLEGVEINITAEDIASECEVEISTIQEICDDLPERVSQCEEVISWGNRMPTNSANPKAA